MGIDFSEVLRERHKWALEYKKSGGDGSLVAILP